MNMPMDVEVGQIWYHDILERDILIVEELDDGSTVRCAPLTVVDIKGKDVLIKKSEYGFIGSNMTVLSKAIIPIPDKHLKTYIGKIDPEIAVRAKWLYNEADMGYDDVAKEFVAQIIEVTTQILFNIIYDL